MRNPLWRFLAGATLSFYGDWLTTVAIVVLVVRVTGSEAAPAAYMLARVLPRIVGAGPGGAIADRFGGSRVVAVFSLLQGVLTAAIIPAEHAGSTIGVFAAVVAAQLCNGVSRSAVGTVLPSVVLSSGLPRANALYNTGLASSLFVAPALASPLLAWRGPDLLLALDVGTFFVAALFMLSLPVRVGMSAQRPIRDAFAGLRIVANDPTLRALAGTYLADAIAVTVGGSVLVLAAEERFGGDSVVGLLYAAVGLGDILGAAVCFARGRPPKGTRIVVLGWGMAAIVSLALLSLTHSLALAVLPLIANGFCEITYQTWGPADMQRRVRPEVLGRVNGVIVLAQSLGMVLGALAAIILVPLVHWDRALYISCCLSLVVLLLVIATGPSRSRATPRRALTTDRQQQP
jgi:MFS family permease